MRNRNFITNVWLLSLVPAIIVVILFHFDHNRFNIELIRTDIISSGQYIFYDDLDMDGVSERIVAFDQFNSSGISISSQQGIREQWNFRGSFDFALKNSIFLTGDCDGNGKKEIYTFTIFNDSIFLHCINDIDNPDLLFANRFVAVTGKGIKKPDPFIIPAEMDDLDNDGIRELIFGIGTGFSEYPRKVFAYFISSDSLLSSPDASYFIRGIRQADFNNDGKSEILPWGYAAGNVEPELALYHDYSSYLFALGPDMNFLFKPYEIPGVYANILPFIRIDDAGNRLSALYSQRSIKQNSIIINFNNKGEFLDSVRLGFHSWHVETTGSQYFFIVNEKGMFLCDRNFRVAKETRVLPSSFSKKDIDDDGMEEILAHNLNDGKLYIFREGLKAPASIKVTIASSGWDIASLRKGYDPFPTLSIQTGQNHYLLSYRQNRSYLISFFYYPGVYFAVLSFGLLVRTVQRNQLRKRYENEKKISELQLALIRNQLDPHFTLNAINSIIYSVNYGDRDDAAQSLRCFAGMYRDMVLSAGSSRRSIDDEIAFCRSYLNLEKVRFGDRFDYDISIACNVDTKRLIPKFLIQIHCENAVKHGISPMESGGMLNIRITSDQKELLISISDNGIGREKAAKLSADSTGKGLHVMDELYKLYNKLFNERIVSSIIDRYNENGEPEGTCVIISITQSEQKQLNLS